MPTLIDSPTPVPVPGGKRINEYVGAVNSATQAVSIAHMHSPAGWSEPGQCPEFDEYTIVLKGDLQVECEQGALDVRAGQAVVVGKGEWVRYSTAHGAEYISVCIPAFTTAAAHRDASA
jgi:mannose-6-phosphate isomerase-like protein (cupin superfamily)